MSLWHIKTIAPCISYPDNGQCYANPPAGMWNYNRQLLTCPQHFHQSISTVNNFFYEPGNDKLIAYITLATTYWPSWDIERYEFSAESGAWLNRADVFAKRAALSANAAFWTGYGSVGSFNKVYACSRAGVGGLMEIDPINGGQVDGGWSGNTYAWNPQSIYTFCLVNRNDAYFVGASNWFLEIWKNLGASPCKVTALRLPNTISYLCYESRNYCWAITHDGVILKADYRIPRWEMISTVYAPTADTRGYYLAFDTTRKRVVVLRWLADGADGACRLQLEFYYPMVNAGQLTQPVPVTSLRAGTRITLAAHLIGEAGEGVTPYNVKGALVGPAAGRLVNPFSGTELNGRVCFQYQAPSEACTETLQLNIAVVES